MLDDFRRGARRAADARRHRRHLGRPRPGHDDHLGGRPGRRPSRPAGPGIAVLAPGSVEATADRLAEAVRPGDAVLVMGGGRSYRIGELLLERLEATRMIDYAAGGELLEAYGSAWETFDGDAWVDLFTEDAEYHEDPFGAPLVGHNALRAVLLEAAEAQRDVEFTVERHWVSGTTRPRGLARGVRPAADGGQLAGSPGS